MNGRSWTVVIPGWHPTRLNALMNCHWKRRGRLKRADADMIAFYARRAGIPEATGKRRVRMTITLAKGQRAFDPDAPWKVVLDSLVACQMLTDDNRQGVELGGVEFDRGQARSTAIIIEEIT